MNQTVTKREIRLGRRVIGPRVGASFRLQKGSLEERLVTIPFESLARHACIFGKTGSGKSVTGMVLAKELSALGDISVLILDRTGEFARSPLSSLPNATVYTPGLNLTISPFSRRSDNRGDDLERSVSLMHHFVGTSFKGAVFSPYQERALRDALKTCYGFDSSRLSDVLSELDAQGERSKKEVKGWLEGNQAVISRLTPLASGSLARVFDVDGPGLSESSLFEPGLHIVNLGALQTDEARNMMSQVLCELLISYGKKLGRTGGLRFVLLVDEAQHIAPSRWDYDGILENYAGELRKYGMGLVVIATRPTQVSENIIAHSNTIVCHSMTSGKDIDLALNYMVGKLAAKGFSSGLRALEVGECFVRLADETADTPVGCRVGLPEHGLQVDPPLSGPDDALPLEAGSEPVPASALAGAQGSDPSSLRHGRLRYDQLRAKTFLDFGHEENHGESSRNRRNREGREGLCQGSPGPGVRGPERR